MYTLLNDVVIPPPLLHAKKVTHVSSGKVLSIDIGKGTIHLVVGSNKNGILEVDSAFSIPTPQGAVKEGLILDRSALAFAINELIKESGIKGQKGGSSRSRAPRSSPVN